MDGEHNACIVCGIEVAPERMVCGASCRAKHARSKRTNNRHTKYDDPGYRTKMSERATDANQKRFDTQIADEDRTCPVCGTAFRVRYNRKSSSSIRKHDRVYCSQACSGKVVGPQNGVATKSETARVKLSRTHKQRFQDGLNQTTFNNPEHRTRATTSNTRSSSKGERAIRETLKALDPDWAAHRHVAGKAVDVLNTRLEIVVEYDGIWHFQQVHAAHDFVGVQRKDRAVAEWCQDNGYKLYRIRDDVFHTQFGGDPALVAQDIYGFLASPEPVLLRY